MLQHCNAKLIVANLQLLSDAEIPEPPLFAPAHTCQGQLIYFELIKHKTSIHNKYLRLCTNLV